MLVVADCDFTKYFSQHESLVLSFDHVELFHQDVSGPYNTILFRPKFSRIIAKNKHHARSNSLILPENPAVAGDQVLLSRAPAERVFAYLNSSFRDLYVLQPASPEAVLSDVLQLLWEGDAPQLFAVLERVVLYAS